MNKYKMISICSLTIACVLMLSILLPIKTNANDKESLELNMHYENSQVTANITVNSDIYTGVVCKYIMVDDVYKSEDLLAQTRDGGTTINLDKSENDQYEAIIPNVTKRYVVIYVSIGNCSLCDYIDCQPNQQNNSNNSESQNNTDEGHNMSAEGEGSNGQNIEVNTDNKQEEQNNTENKNEQQTEQNNEENKNEQQTEQNNEENKNEQQTEQNNEENKTEQTNNNSNTENNKAEPPTNTNNNNTNSGQPTEQTTGESNVQNGNDKIVVDNKTDSSTDFQTIEDASNNSSNKSSANGNSNNNNSQNSNQGSNTDKNVLNKNNNNKVGTGDKDAIDTSDFQEIEKTTTTSTANGNMPQTGEDDSIKIFGIILFSLVSVFSFYKYKTTK